MSKPLLTLGIILSLGTVGCASVGVPQGTSYASARNADRGVDTLWQADRSASRAGVAGVVDGASASETRADLWNPAPRTEPANADERPKGGLFVSNPSSGIAF